MLMSFHANDVWTFIFMTDFQNHFPHSPSFDLYGFAFVWVCGSESLYSLWNRLFLHNAVNKIPLRYDDVYEPIGEIKPNFMPELNDVDISTSKKHCQMIHVRISLLSTAIIDAAMDAVLNTMLLLLLCIDRVFTRFFCSKSLQRFTVLFNMEIWSQYTSIHQTHSLEQH